MRTLRMLILSMLLILSFKPSISVVASDKETLTSLYNSCNGQQWNRNQNWIDPSKSICEWEGIECIQNGSEDVVHKVDLSDNNLSGILPIRLLLQMPHLRVLKLSGNSFQWSDDYDKSQISSNLMYLDLSGTGLNLIESIFTNVDLPALTDLYLSMNGLFGEFPQEIFQVKSTLERLKLDGNNLNGFLPNNLSEFSNLKSLNLSDNYFEGQIPSSITELSKLRYLLLRRNKLSGPIPTNIGGLDFLQELDLSRQSYQDSASSENLGISGPLPSFSTLTQLQRLDLSFNSITGNIKFDFLKSVDPNKFDYAFLMSNSISGTIPSSLIHLPQGSIYLQDNKIEGISPELCNPNRSGAVSIFGCDAILCGPNTYNDAGRQEQEDVKCLDCETATFYGSTSCPIRSNESVEITPITDSTPSIPSNESSPPAIKTDLQILQSLFADCGGNEWTHKDGWMTSDSFCNWYGVTCVDDGAVESVRFLILSDNNLKGNVPSSIYDLPNLQSLSLGSNDVIISFFGIENAKSLAILDLKHSNLFNLNELEKASALMDLDLSNNNLEGDIPSNIFALTSLWQLKLDDNKLSGVIPADVENLINLKYFSANANQLSGRLPDSLSLLPLQNLLLRSNNLSGPIDEILNSLTSLKFADLAHQKENGGGFTGAVPDLANLHDLRRLDLSYNSLSGEIPMSFLSSVNKESFEFANLSSNRIIGKVPMVLKDLHDIYLQDNMIDTVPRELCSGTDILKEFGCDAILCSPGSFNVLGRRQSFDTLCQSCPEAQYYGAISCPPTSVSVLPTFSTPSETSTTSTTSSTSEVSLPSPPLTPELESMSDRAILELLFQQCGGEEWNDKVGWMDDGVSICRWTGIQCDSNEKVESISLRSNNLIGVPPKEIFDFKSLTSITFESNFIDFDFTGIENAIQLSTLDLSHTEVASVIGIQKSSSITHLYLASTNLRGEFPVEIFELHDLVDLSLEFNHLTGQIPPQIGNLANLAYFSIHDNKMSGNLPSTLGQLTNLQFFLARQNNFSGPIPIEFSNLPHLWFVDIANQKSYGGTGITGNLPLFNNLQELRRLDLNSNSLTGEIPPDFLAKINIDSFEYVDLSNNEIEGKVPRFTGDIPIGSIYLSDNRITGIDQSLCDGSVSYLAAKYGCDSILCPPQFFNDIGKQTKDNNPCRECQNSPSLFYGATDCPLQSQPIEPPSSNENQSTEETDGSSERDILKLFYNSCGGDSWERKDNWMDDSVSICSWFGIRCVDPEVDQHVQYILLSSNNIVGIPPNDLFFLKRLDTLILDNNPISFDFTNIGSADKLTTLDLSSTSITSIEGISAAENLVKLQLTSNDLKGPIPDELFSMSKLEQLSLDFNKYSGAIPNSIGNLSNLRLFSCAFNDLTGSIPASIGDLNRIVTLRLQSNSLSGTIPVEIGSMTELAFLDLSQQKSSNNPGLTGSIPDFANLQDLHRVDIKSNSISGTIPSTFLERSNAEYVNLIDLSDNRLTGKPPQEISKFDHLNLQGNMISELDDSFCNTAFGCNGFLCPPYSYNPSKGRQESSSSLCETCLSAQFYGSIRCDDNNEHNVPSTTTIDQNTPDPGSSTEVSTQASQPPPLLSGDPPGSNMSDRDILTLFYAQCKGEHWHFHANWMSSASICDWEGITCVSGTEFVEKIELGANNVAGIPPVELYQLKFLQSLVLYSNPLTDFKFDWIKEAQSLKDLVLDATGIESIKGIEMAPSLKKVMLRFNDIRGNIGDITDLETLEFLSVSNNHLTGTLPSDFVNLKNLKALLLGNNHLEGDITGVRFPGSLKILDLSSNDLVGTIPSSFLTEFSNTVDLSVDLSANKFTGTVPSSLARFSQLELYLRDNYFSHIAQEVCVKGDWNGGNVGKYGCKGLMCPKGKSAPDGRQTETHRCTSCKHAKHLGSSFCHTDQSSANKGNAEIMRIFGLIIGLTTLMVVTMQ